MRRTTRPHELACFECATLRGLSNATFSYTHDMNAQRAIVAGVAGALAMDLVQDGFSAIFERGRARGDRDEETEAIVAVVRRLARLLHDPRTTNEPGIAGRTLHYTFGIAFAVAYGTVRARYPKVAVGNGLGFGVALWILSDVVLIPALHLGRPLGKYSWFERANALCSHVTYAVTVESLLRES
jgi:hypothetical protein